MAKNEKGLKMKRDKKKEGKFRTRWGQFKVLLRQVIDALLYLSLTPLKQVYCSGSLARLCSTPQKTKTIAAGQMEFHNRSHAQWRAKKRCNMQHVEAVFAPTAIARFSWNVNAESLNIELLQLKIQRCELDRCKQMDIVTIIKI